jgi:hypothetical protein
MAMPDRRSHRGPHPDDEELFSPEAVAGLRKAVADLSWLLTRGYADKASLILVGDHLSLTQRQRLAVMRSSCSDDRLAVRLGHRVAVEALGHGPMAIDGYNVLITVEAALSGGFLFRGRDGCLRDLASVHGTYRKVDETLPAVARIGGYLAARGVSDVLWLLDSPVSNSGRLKTLILDEARTHGWPWCVELCDRPDPYLIRTDRIVASSDSVVLDGCGRWFNLATEIIVQDLASARIIDLLVPR